MGLKHGHPRRSDPHLGWLDLRLILEADVCQVFVMLKCTLEDWPLHGGSRVAGWGFSEKFREEGSAVFLVDCGGAHCGIESLNNYFKFDKNE